MNPSKMFDVDYIAEHMRIEDIKEVEAQGLTSLNALRHGFENSDICITLKGKDGMPGAMLGVAPSPYSDFGAIWLLGTPAIEANTVAFLRHSKPVLKTLYEHTGYLAFYNYTHGQNQLHHRWLKWLGFTFIRCVPIEPSKELFYEFVRLKGT